MAYILYKIKVGTHRLNTLLSEKRHAK